MTGRGRREDGGETKDERVSGEMKGGTRNRAMIGWTVYIEPPPYSHEWLFPVAARARLFVFDQNSITLNVHRAEETSTRLCNPRDDVPRKKPRQTLYLTPYYFTDAALPWNASRAACFSPRVLPKRPRKAPTLNGNPFLRYFSMSKSSILAWREDTSVSNISPREWRYIVLNGRNYSEKFVSDGKNT